MKLKQFIIVGALLGLTACTGSEDRPISIINSSEVPTPPTTTGTTGTSTGGTTSSTGSTTSGTTGTTGSDTAGGSTTSGSTSAGTTSGTTASTTSGSTTTTGGTPPLSDPLKDAIKNQTQDILKQPAFNPAITNSDATCSLDTSFFCLMTPTDGQNEIGDSSTVDLKIDLCQVAKNSLPDPAKNQLGDPEFVVVVVNPSAKVGNAYPFYLKDLSVEGDCNYKDPKDKTKGRNKLVATLHKAIPLIPFSSELGGSYVLSVGAFKEGGGWSAKSRWVIVPGKVDVKLVSLLPAGKNYFPAKEEDRTKEIPVNETGQPPSVSAEALLAKVQINSFGTQKTQIRFYNYGSQDPNQNAQATPLYVSAGGDYNYSDKPAVTKPALLRLVPGVNYFTVVASSEVNGKTTGQTLRFAVNNFSPKVAVKVLAPTQRVVEAGAQLQFCLVNAVGAASDPNGSCLKEWPQGAKLPEVRVMLNGMAVTDPQLLKRSGTTYTLDLNTGNAKAPVYVGQNLYSIIVTPQEGQGLSSKVMGNFGFGKLNPFNGDEKFADGIEKNGMIEDGLSLEVARSILTNDLKNAILSYLNGPDIKEQVRNILKRADVQKPVPCPEYRTYLMNDTSLEFDESSRPLQLGNFEVLAWNLTGGAIELTVRINGLHGDAWFKGFQGAVNGSDFSLPLSFDVDTLTLTVALNINGGAESGLKIDISPQVGKVNVVEFSPPTNFVTVNLDKVKGTDEEEWVKPYKQREFEVRSLVRNAFNQSILCGTDARLNDSLKANSEKLANLLDQNDNFLRLSLNTTIEALAKTLDLNISYDIYHAKEVKLSETGLKISQIPIRVAPSKNATFEGKKILDELLNDPQAGSISNPAAPTNQPPPLTAIRGGNRFARGSASLGGFDSFDGFGNIGASRFFTNEFENLRIQLSDGLINSFLFAATASGLVDLTVDGNFFTKNNIGFINEATPVLKDMFKGVILDVNGDGIANDENEPIQLRLKADRLLPPTIHFLNDVERQNLKNQLQEKSAKILNEKVQLARVNVPNLELSVYPAQALQRKTYCRSHGGATEQYPPIYQDLFDNERLAAAEKDVVYNLDVTPDPTEKDAQGMPIAKPLFGPGAIQNTSFFFEKTGSECPLEDPSDPNSQRMVEVAGVPVETHTPADAKPLVSFKVNLGFYIVIHKVTEEHISKDFLTKDGQLNPDIHWKRCKKGDVEKDKDGNDVPCPEGKLVKDAMGQAKLDDPNFYLPTRFLRLQILPDDFSSKDNLEVRTTDILVDDAKNHTAYVNGDSNIVISNTVRIQDRLESILNFSLGKHLENFNEIRIPLTGFSRFPSIAATEEDSKSLRETLAKFGWHSIDLGSSEFLPKFEIDGDPTNAHLNFDVKAFFCRVGEANGKPCVLRVYGNRWGL